MAISSSGQRRLEQAGKAQGTPMPGDREMADPGINHTRDVWNLDEGPSAPKPKFSEIAKSSNVDALLTEQQSDKIGRMVVEGYEADLRSRAEWEKKTQEANKLAMQVMESKSFPFEGASNVKFPLLTVATLQFAARAYGALLRGPDVVKCRVIGRDDQGKKAARASRVGAHMSYQVLEEDDSWEEEHDRLLMAVPIVGCSFVKNWYDPVVGRNRSSHVLAWDLVINYYAKSVEQAERKTHRFYLYEREIRERQLNGIYADKDLGYEGLPEDRPEDERQGITPPEIGQKQARLILEQHTWVDLDGDGYEEPYVITVLKDTGKVLRIVPRFEKVVSEQSIKIEKLTAALQAAKSPDVFDSVQRQIQELRSEEPDVLRIEPQEYFTKFPFVPAPDGGIYDLGFGQLLGPVNEAVNTLINELIDNGKLQNQSSGFIGRGARIKGGQLRFKFGEWKRVDVTGATLKESIVPLPVNAPSPVLFQMLGLLINYGEKVASVSEVTMGENVGQNTPAYNYSQMLGQGMAVFSGIFKRLHRALRDEFRKIYRLNRRHLSAMEYFQVLDGPNMQIFQNDYGGDPTDVVPAADSNTILSEEKQRQAILIAERSRAVPGYNLAVVERRLLEAMAVADPDDVFPLDDQGQPAIPPPPNPEAEMQRLEEQRKALEAQSRHVREMKELAMKERVADADVALKEVQAVAALAQAGSVERELAVKEFDAATKRAAAQRKENDRQTESS